MKALLKKILIAVFALFGVFVVALGGLICYGRGFRTGSATDSAWVAKTAAWEKYLTVEGYRLRVLDVGQGTPILLLHGWCDSTFTWREIIPRMKDRYRLIALDWPGFGFSDKSPAPFGHPLLARIAIGLLDQLGVEKAFIVGNSMGGAAALKTAAQFPHRLLGLVVLDAHTAQADARRNWAFHLLMTPGLGEAAAWAMGRLTLRQVSEGMVFNRAVVTSEVVDEMYIPITTPGARMALLQQLRENNRHPVPWDEAAKVTAPTLIIWGRNDPLTGLADGQRLHGVISGSKLEILDHTGHVPLWEQPDAVAKLLDEFFRAVGSSSMAPPAAGR